MIKAQKLTRTLLLGFSASAFGQVVTLATQVLQLPVLLNSYGVTMTGEWLLLSTIPAYVALSDVGLSNVAANEVSMAVSSGRIEDAQRLLHSLCRFAFTIATVILFLIVSAAWAIDWVDLLNLKAFTLTDAAITLSFLSASAVVYLSSGIFFGLYQACSNGPRILTLMNSVRLVELLALLGFVWLRLNLSTVAAMLFFVRCLLLLVIWLDSRRFGRSLSIGYAHGSWSEVRRMLTPGIGFMAFPVGNAMYFQGVTLVVNATLGSAAVVTLNACRIFSRAAPLALSVIRQPLWMQYPHLYARNEISKIRSLQRLATELALALFIGSLVFSFPFGAKIVMWWTGGAVHADTGLIILFVSIAGFNGYWTIASTPLMALNEHGAFAKLYVSLVGMALLAVYICSRLWELEGAGFALLCVEIPLCVSALATSSKLSGDTIEGVLKSTIRFGSSWELIKSRILRRQHQHANE